jgi:hypothetical protein
MRFEVSFTTVLLKIQVLWDVTLYCVVLHLPIFRKTECLHIQVLKTFETLGHTQHIVPLCLYTNLVTVIVAYAFRYELLTESACQIWL